MQARLWPFMALLTLAVLFNAMSAVVGEQIRDRAAQHEDKKDE